MAPHLRVPTAALRARVERIPLVGHVRVYTLAVPDRPAPVSNGVERLVNHLLERGECAACGQPLDQSTYLPGIHLASCHDGHWNDLGPALRLLQHRETR